MFKLCYSKMIPLPPVWFKSLLSDYTFETYTTDLQILTSLYRIVTNLQTADCGDLAPYFMARFLTKLEKIPFINILPYLNMDYRGMEIAIEDVEDSALVYFEYISR